MHVRYPKQLEYKREILKQSLIKYAQVDPRRISNVLPSEDIFAYRNQFKMPCGVDEGYLESGMFLPNTNYFLGIKKCIIHDKGLEEIRREIMKVLNNAHMEAYSHKTKKGLRNLIVRGFDGKYQCTLVTGENEIGASLIQKLMQIKGMYSLWQSVHTTKENNRSVWKKSCLACRRKISSFTA